MAIILQVLYLVIEMLFNLAMVIRFIELVAFNIELNTPLAYYSNTMFTFTQN